MLNVVPIEIDRSPHLVTAHHKSLEPRRRHGFCSPRAMIGMDILLDKGVRKLADDFVFTPQLLFQEEDGLLLAQQIFQYKAFGIGQRIAIQWQGKPRHFFQYIRLVSQTLQDGLQGIGLEDVTVIGMNRGESQDGCFHK